jgi:hypothetical protein
MNFEPTQAHSIRDGLGEETMESPEDIESSEAISILPFAYGSTEHHEIPFLPIISFQEAELLDYPNIVQHAALK